MSSPERIVCTPAVAEWEGVTTDGALLLPHRIDVAPRSSRERLRIEAPGGHRQSDRRILASWSPEDRPQGLSAATGGGVLVSYDDGSRRDGWSRSAMRSLPANWVAISGRGDTPLYWAVDYLDSLVDCPRRKRLHWHDSPSGFADLFLPETPDRSAPLVVMLHGGFWREAWTLDTMALCAASLAADGMHVLSVEYPASGVDVPDGAALVTELTDRLPRLVEHLLPTLPCRPAVLLTGHSAGGQLALMLGDYLGDVADVVGIVAHGAITDVVAAWEEGIGARAADLLVGSVPPDQRRAMLESISPVHALTSVEWPTLVIHGRDDDRVPVEQAERFCEKLSVDSVIWDSIPHLDYLSPETPAWKVTHEWIRSKT